MAFYRNHPAHPRTYPQISNSSPPRSRACRLRRSMRCASSEKAGDPQLEAQLRLTVYFRPANEGETPMKLPDPLCDPCRGARRSLCGDVLIRTPVS